jgi:two-component system, OmpR family, sensor kinase
MSIRLRLTLLYSVILALTLVLFSGTLYAIQSQSTLNVHKRDLAATADRMARGMSIMARLAQGIPEHGPGAAAPGASQDASGQRADQEFRLRDTVRYLYADGTVAEFPINDQEMTLPLDSAGLQAVQHGQAWSEIARVDGVRWLIYNQPVIHNGQVIGIVQVARSLADRDRSLEALAVTLSIGSLVTILGAFGIGWVLSGFTLRPIHRITQTAQDIGAERDLSKRVEYVGPNDEVGQLAATFNTMLVRLEEAYQEVAHSLEMQRGFVADVSHELRTPLTTIRGNLALLGRDPPFPAEETSDILRDMEDESDRLIRLVNNLLTLARADAGRCIEREPVEVKSLIEDVCAQARLLAPKGTPERTIVCDTLSEATVSADRDALRQVVLVLLDNAIKHAAGPILVTTDVQDCLVTIAVRDHGPGMDAETMAHIFDRFYRADVARSSPGFGLGLPIAKALVDAQDGAIAVASQVGQGSEFRVSLPRLPVNP